MKYNGNKNLFATKKRGTKRTQNQKEKKKVCETEEKEKKTKTENKMRHCRKTSVTQRAYTRLIL